MIVAENAAPVTIGPRVTALLLQPALEAHQRYPGIDLDKVVRLYVDEKYGASEVAQRITGLTADDVYDILAALQVPLRRPRRAAGHWVTPEIAKEMRRLYEAEELTVSEIGKRTGFDPSIVSDHLRNAGVQMRPAKRKPGSGRTPSPMEAAEVLRLYLVEGLSISVLAKKLGIRRAGLTTWLREQGVRIRSVEEQRQVDREKGRKPTPREQVTIPHRGHRRELPVDKLRELYVEQRLGMRGVAASLGVGVAAVRWNLHAAGIPIKPARVPRKEDRPLDVHKQQARDAARSRRPGFEADQRNHDEE